MSDSRPLPSTNTLGDVDERLIGKRGARLEPFRDDEQLVKAYIVPVVPKCVLLGIIGRLRTAAQNREQRIDRPRRRTGDQLQVDRSSVLLCGFAQVVEKPGLVDAKRDATTNRRQK